MLVSVQLLGTEKIEELEAQGFNAVVLELDESASKESTRNAAEAIEKAGFSLYYWVEVARNEAMADAHPEWMCSLQGHPDWRRLFETNNDPKEGEVVKTYPWVPILYKETFTAHLERIRELLLDVPEAKGIFLNDLQGGPSACGCGSAFCRWTSDYGVILTATPYSEKERYFPAVVNAAADFVQAVKELAPASEVIPVWLTECEEHDRPRVCGNVGCYLGYCWRYYEQQLDLLVPRIERLGVLAPFRALDRDLPVYGEEAGWVKWALDSYGALPPKKEREVIEAERLLAVLQGWDVTEEEVEAQIQRSKEAGAGGYVLSLMRIDQSWKPRVVRYER